MSKTSKKYFSNEFKKEIWKSLVNALKDANSEADVIKALERLFTPAELNNLEKRLAINYLIANGKTYKKISEVADVHYTTISYIKKGFKKKPVVHRQYSPLNKDNKKISSRGNSLFRPYRFIRKNPPRF